VIISKQNEQSRFLEVLQHPVGDNSRWLRGFIKRSMKYFASKDLERSLRGVLATWQSQEIASLRSQ